jgi:hypothetical protein
MDEEDTTATWKVAFFVTLVLLVVSIGGVVYLNSQRTKLSNQLTSASSSLSQLNSSNAQNQQQCISQANQAIGIDPFLSDSLQSRINSCQAEYPTN